MAAAQEQAALRLRALNRQKDLVGRGVGTEATLEAAELADVSARQAILSRKQALQQAEARRDLALARVDRTQISVAEAERNLADTTLTAPFQGTLADVAVVAGGSVTANERIGQLVDVAQMEVAFRVSTAQHARLLDDGGRLRPADVTVRLESFGLELTRKGRLTREAATVGDGQTGRLIYAAIDDSRGLRPGDFVEVAITEDPLNWVARLPAAAVSASNRVLVVGPEDRLSEAEVSISAPSG